MRQNISFLSPQMFINLEVCNESVAYEVMLQSVNKRNHQIQNQNILFRHNCEKLNCEKYTKSKQPHINLIAQPVNVPR